MRVRKIILEEKELYDDTGWHTDDLPPRHSWIFAKTKPMRSGRIWRSANARGTHREYLLLVQCNPGKDQWKAWLICEVSKGRYSLVSRLEYHGNHPGLHVHSHCVRSGIEEGPSSIDNLVRIPDADEHHRRVNAWRENTFWELARSHFRIEYQPGSLI